jgi:hypothetical protein
MKDVSRSTASLDWIAIGCWLAALSTYILCAYFVGFFLRRSPAGNVVLWFIMAIPFLGGAVAFVLVLSSNQHAPRDSLPRLPAGVEAAARQRFNAPRPSGGSEGVSGPDERIVPDREGLQGAD